MPLCLHVRQRFNTDAQREREREDHEVMSIDTEACFQTDGLTCMWKHEKPRPVDLTSCSHLEWPRGRVVTWLPRAGTNALLISAQSVPAPCNRSSVRCDNNACFNASLGVIRVEFRQRHTHTQLDEWDAEMDTAPPTEPKQHYTSDKHSSSNKQSCALHLFIWYLNEFWKDVIQILFFAFFILMNKKMKIIFLLVS